MADAVRTATKNQSNDHLNTQNNPDAANHSSGFSLPSPMKNKTKRKPFKCDECRKITHLSEADIWDKVIRCAHCAEILMDNRRRLQLPKKP